MSDWTVIEGDCLEAMRGMADGSVSAIIADPPYGYGLLPWDNPVDIAAFTREAARVCSGFYAVFGQMPGIADWHAEAVKNRMHFCEHISWVKRNCTPTHRLKRGHECIYIYATGKQRQYYKTTGPYEDVKVPGVLVDTVSLEGIDRYIKDLRCKVNGGTGTYMRGEGGNAYGGDGKKFSPSLIGDRSPELANYTNVWSFLPPGQRTRNGELGHPTEKPLDIMSRLVEMLTPPGGIVLDPYAGSGTVGVAAVLAGVDFIGVELRSDYCTIARNRIAAAASQPRLVGVA